VSTWALGRYLLEIEFYSFASAIILGMLIGLLVSLIAGVQLHRKIQSASTMECLRAA
jgi:ABC-type antimicrobial peptide transport system permease subunit